MVLPNVGILSLSYTASQLRRRPLQMLLNIHDSKFNVSEVYEILFYFTLEIEFGALQKVKHSYIFLFLYNLRLNDFHLISVQEFLFLTLNVDGPNGRAV